MQLASVDDEVAETWAAEAEAEDKEQELHRQEEEKDEATAAAAAADGDDDEKPICAQSGTCGPTDVRTTTSLDHRQAINSGGRREV